MKSVSIIIPVYNEEKAVYSTISKIKESIKKTENCNFEIIAVNDGSTDKSRQILEKINGIRLISHPYNKGYGASLKTGMRNSGSEWVLITDADGTYPIEDIPKLLKYMDEYDMIVGSRTGKNVAIPFFRKPAKKFINGLANFMSGKKIPDLNSGFRLFKKEYAMEFYNLYPSGFSFTTTITLAFLTNDYNVKYVPINYYKRDGKSTIHPLKDFAKFIVLIFRMVTYFNPLKLFLPFGLMLFLGGFIGDLIYLIATNFSKTLPLSGILAMLMGIQILFLGLLADLIVKRGYSYEKKK
jgi:glycosyltransferase involved in cell wall biosynthesis